MSDRYYAPPLTADVRGFVPNLGLLQNLGVRGDNGRLSDLGLLGWTPAQLFGPNDVGLWYDYAAITPEMLAWRRNLLTWTEQFENAAWSKVNTTVTQNDAVAPDGTTTADKILEAAVTNIHTVQNNPSFAFAAGTAYAVSIYAKPAEREFLAINIGGGVAGAAFNLGTGVLNGITGDATTTNRSASIEPVGNGWYRCALLFTMVGASTTTARFCLGDTPTSTSVQPNYAGDITKGIFLWGAQLEVGSSATAYQRITDFTSDFVAAFPTTAIYQDSTGVTPVTALGQPVGLVLDKSRGGAANLGPELVTNGDFSDGLTGWTATGATASVTGGVATVSQVSVGTAGSIYRSISVVAGQCYVLQGDISIVSGTAGVGTQVAIRATSDQFSTLLASVQWDSASRAVIYRAATTGTVFLHARVGATSGLLVANFDNISVREVPGNHAIQSTPTARPVWDARNNLLLQTQNFASTAWVKVDTSVTANTTAAPDGTLTATTLTPNATSNPKWIHSGAIARTSGATYTASVFAKPNGYQYLQISLSGNSFPVAGRKAAFDLTDGTFVTQSGVTAQAVAVGDGWYRISVTVTANATFSADYGVGFVAVGSKVVDDTAFVADGTSGYYLWGAQLEVSPTVTSYQRVTTATDYADVGFSRGALFDGSDDFLVTAANLNLSGTDEVTVIVGVNKRSDAATSVAVELTADITANTNAFVLLAPSTSGANSYRFISRGTGALSGAGAGVFAAAPDSSVMTGLGDISADITTLRRNGVLVQTDSTTDQGTGNYSNAILYLGRRGGTIAPLNGRITQLIIIGRVLSDAELAQVERYVATQSGVLIP